MCLDKTLMQDTNDSRQIVTTERVSHQSSLTAVASSRLFCQPPTTGHFTFWISLSLSVSLSPKFGLRPKINQKVRASKHACMFICPINKQRHIISMNNIQGQAARKAHKAQHCWPPCEVVFAERFAETKLRTGQSLIPR